MEVESAVTVSITVTPNPVTLRVNDTQIFNATGEDAQGDATPIDPDWSVIGNIGDIVKNEDGSATFTATTVGTGSVKAADYGVFGLATVTVESPITITITADPSAVEPEEDSTITVTATENNEPKSGVSVSLSVTAVEHSGGHSHNGNRDEHKGSLDEYSGDTDSNGKFQTAYAAPAFGGTETITATAEGQTASVGLNIRVPDLAQLSDGPYYDLIGGTEYHLGPPVSTTNHNHAARIGVRTAIRSIAITYHLLFSDDEDLHINDISLPNGGLFGISGEWTPPHHEHRHGLDADVRLWSIPEDHRAAFEDIVRLFNGNPEIHPDPPHYHLDWGD